MAQNLQGRQNIFNLPLYRRGMQRFHLWIAVIFTAIFTGIWLDALQTGSHYKYDFFFLLLLLWGLYVLRDRLCVHWAHYLLFGIFLLSHNMGAFGWYSTFPLGLEYDLWVHSYFGFVATLMLYRGYHRVGPYKGWMMWLAILVVVLGFSAFHELFEFTGAVTVGEGEGVLFLGAGDNDPFDTQKDMFNNVWGGLIALVGYIIYDRLYPSRHKKKRLSFA